jgi:hypothetical protein
MTQRRMKLLEQYPVRIPPEILSNIEQRVLQLEINTTPNAARWIEFYTSNPYRNPAVIALRLQREFLVEEEGDILSKDPAYQRLLEIRAMVLIDREPNWRKEQQEIEQQIEAIREQLIGHIHRKLEAIPAEVEVLQKKTMENQQLLVSRVVPAVVKELIKHRKERVGELPVAVVANLLCVLQQEILSL